MNTHKNIDIILEENRKLLSMIKSGSAVSLVKKMDKAANIFCFAVGRSGYIMQCFCMRLMHLQYTVYFVGETITPKIGDKDLLIILSGSGETVLTHQVVRIAKKEQAKIYGVVGSANSSIGRITNYTLCLPGGAKTHFPGDMPSIQAAGSLFEQSAFIFFEAVILEIYKRQNHKPNNILEKHTNLE